MMILGILFLAFMIVAGGCKLAFRMAFGLTRLLGRFMMLIFGLALIGVLIACIRFLPVLLLIGLICWVFGKRTITA